MSTKQTDFFSELKEKTNDFYSNYNELMQNYSNKNYKQKKKLEEEEKDAELMKQQLHQPIIQPGENPNTINFNGQNFSKEELLNFINQQQASNPNNNGIDAEGGKVIVPEPFYVLKMFDKRGEKIFFNITTHEDIQPPNEEHILEMNSQLGIRVPLSLSEKKEDFDVNGKICQVYDVIFSSKIKDRLENEIQFVAVLLCERVKQRFGHEVIPEKFVRLKNLKYKGSSVRSQRVKIKQNKIKEIIKKEEDKVTNSHIKSIAEKEVEKITKQIVTPDWCVLLTMKDLFENNNNEFNHTIKDIIEYLKKNDMTIKRKDYLSIFSNVQIKNLDLNEEIKEDSSIFKDIIPYIRGLNYSKKSAAFIYFFSLPMISKSFAVNVYLKKSYIRVSVPKMYFIELNLPCIVKKEHIRSYFDKNSRYLIIYIDNPTYLEAKKNKNQNKDNHNDDKEEENNEEEEFTVNIDDAYLYDVVN